MITSTAAGPCAPHEATLSCPTPLRPPPCSALGMCPRPAAGAGREDGRQIPPDPEVTIYEFTGALATPPGLGYAPALAGARLSGGDPVDLGTGLFVMRKTDLVLPDLIPIVLTRTYRPG